MRQAARVLDLDFTLETIFEKFQTHGDPELEKALSEAMCFCRDMASATTAPRWLTLLGKSGVGKTMLAKRINFFFKRFLEPLPDDRNSSGEAWSRMGGFKPWQAVVDDMLAGDYTAIPQLQHDWFLVLDDIGVEYIRNKDLAIAKLYGILNARQGLFTVITANATLEGIRETMDNRIASRLLRDESSVVNINAVDFNLRA